MKILKKINIIAFMVGIFTTSIITVGAKIYLQANQVSISSINTSKTNVYDSIDELYSICSKCPEGYKMSNSEGKTTCVPIHG